MATVRVHRAHGAAAISLEAGALAATIVPDLGLAGIGLRWQGRELLALPGGLRRLAAGHTAGLPLLHPWANRLSGRRYVAAGRAVDLRRLDVPTDANGLPMHGLLVGRPGWTVERAAAGARQATLTAAFAWSGGEAGTETLLAAFPFPHTVVVTIAVSERGLDVTSTVVAAEQPVPVAFGWHPYLRVPGPRAGWRLRLPEREHLVLDRRQIPTGARQPEAAEDGPIGSRTFDDGYALRSDRRFALVGSGVRLDVEFDAGYPFAQVWVPGGRDFACLEPMTAPTDALRTDAYALALPGSPYSATFHLRPSSTARRSTRSFMPSSP